MYGPGGGGGGGGGGIECLTMYDLVALLCGFAGEYYRILS